MRAISPLAEGSDRIFARIAVDLGFELCCPLPFAQSEYEKDFTPGTGEDPDSIANFHALLEHARNNTRVTIFELDGDPDDRPAAYTNGGRVVMNQSDVLVVVWDGARLGRHGGTETTFDAARAKGVPIVLIDAQAPHRWRIMNREREHDLGGLVEELLALPLAESEDGEEALFLWIRGRVRRWHERWLDYRLGAELLRHLRLASLISDRRSHADGPGNADLHAYVRSARVAAAGEQSFSAGASPHAHAAAAGRGLRPARVSGAANVRRHDARREALGRADDALARVRVYLRLILRFGWVNDGQYGHV